MSASQKHMFQSPSVSLGMRAGASAGSTAQRGQKAGQGTTQPADGAQAERAEVLCWGLGTEVVQALGADKGLGEEAGRTSPGSGNNPP